MPLNDAREGSDDALPVAWRRALAAGAGRETAPPPDAAPRPRDWRGVLGRLREGLARLAALPAIREDPVAAMLLAEMAWAEDMEELDACLDRLAQRVAELSHEPAAAVAAALRAQGPLPPALQEEPAAGRRSRTLLRL